MASIYLVRHGQASFGAANYDQLSARGEEQSAVLGQWLTQCGMPVNKVYTGEARRHVQTAQHCLAEVDTFSGSPWQTLDHFNEFDHQQILDRYRPDLADPAAMAAYLAGFDNPRKAFQAAFSAAIQRWLSGVHDADYSQTWTQFSQRCQAGLAQVVREADAARDIWIFTSGGTISAMLQPLLGIGDDRIFDLNWALFNTGVTKLLFSGERISVSYINSYAHLEQRRRSELLTYR